MIEPSRYVRGSGRRTSDWTSTRMYSPTSCEGGEQWVVRGTQNLTHRVLHLAASRMLPCSQSLRRRYIGLPGSKSMSRNPGNGTRPLESLPSSFQSITISISPLTKPRGRTHTSGTPSPLCTITPHGSWPAITPVYASAPVLRSTGR